KARAAGLPLSRTNSCQQAERRSQPKAIIVATRPRLSARFILEAMFRHVIVAFMLSLFIGRLAVEETASNIAVRAENEEFLRQYAQTYRFSLGRPRSGQVTADGSAVLFLRSQPRSFVQDLYEF